jgi:bifunctional DNase/RNase
LTSDLLCSILNRLGASVKSIIITDLQEGTFYANIILRANGTEMKIDSRPSDAIAVAVRVGVPIYVAEAVLDEAGIKPPPDSGGYIIMR